MDKNLLRVFMWKNYLFLKFSWISLSIINLTCFGVLCVYLKSTYNVMPTPSLIYESKNFETLKSYFPGNSDDFVYFYPQDPFLENLIEEVRKDLFIPVERIKPFSNASDMILSLESKQQSNCFAVVFKEWPTIKSEGSLRYSISSSINKLSPKKRFVNDEDVNGIIDDDEYTRTGFLTLQHVIDSNFIRLTNNKDARFEIEISPFPIIAFENIDGQRINTFGALFAVLFNVLLITTMLIPLVEEKHDGIKEFLVLATPHNFLNGLTFFLTRFLVVLPFIIGSVIVAFVYRATGLIPMVYFFVVILFYCFAEMCFVFLISVCFNKVFYAKVGGFLLLLVPYLFCLVEGNLSNVARVLLSTTTFLEGLASFQIFTNKHREFSSSDIFFSISSKLNVFSVLLIFLFQSMFYSILYNYLSRVFPGKGGLKQPFLFFMNPSYFKKKNRNQFTAASNEENETAIIIQDLVKTFKTKNRVIKVADRLNMTIKDRRITVLLGHNGAGKTTTLNMIIGSVPKDSGKIIVCSERDVTSYRHLIGFCPQHSVFMQYMTCYQHLNFFAQLRGKSRAEADSLASELLTQLRLINKANETGKNLSGGMKRRLSLGIALSGDTKVVVLDEPSSGLDVESRRELWDILLEIRKLKAVLITTHHMEEAEVLGDTISILSNGKLEQTGSPLELKRQSGSGYILKLRTEDIFHEQKTLDIIRDSIPSAKIMNTVPPIVLISMPYIYKHKYTEVLERLEGKSSDLGIHSITVTDTSLEDVFLNGKTVDVVDSVSSQVEERINIPYQKLMPSRIKWTRHAYAIFYKKLIFIQSQWIYSFGMFSLPLIAIGFAIFIVNLMLSNPLDEGVKLNLQHLQNGFIYLRFPPNLSSIGDILTSEIENSGIHIRNLSDKLFVEDELLSVQSKNVYDFYEHAIGAVIIDQADNNAKLRVFYSGNIIHSSVIMTNLVDNAVLRFMGDSKHSIEATFAPIRRASDINPTSLEYFAAIIPIGFFFYMLYYVTLPYLESSNHFKTLQAIPRATYWISFVAFDMILHFVVCIACWVFQYLILPTNLYNINQVLLNCTYLFYGFSYLPILYCMSIGFRSVSALSTYLFFMFIVSSIIPFITSGSVQSMQNFEFTIVILSLLPDFSLNHQLRIINEIFFSARRDVLAQTYSHTKIVKQQDQPSPFTFFVYAVVLFVFFMIILIEICDNIKRRQRLTQLFTSCRCNRTEQLKQSSFDEDEELVLKEKRNVENTLQSNNEESYPLLVHNLHKIYRKVHAVRGINFAVKRQECFGLLGVNGAGKTSTFQMITANSPLSGGNVMIDGISILKDETLYKYRFGYCPQRDCLNEFMTSYQILKYMALLRNIELRDINSEVTYWLSQLDLSKYQNVRIRYYSGGTKRKVNAAIAMIGNPSLVLLDEPTTGVDPVSRRFLWNCIRNFQKRDKTVVLTSHSMDECEHLCNRLAIMANGKLRCIGYIPDLKNQYGSGFTIKLLSNSSDVEISSITSAFREEFSNCKLREHHAGVLTYFIEGDSMEWSDVFRRTERFMNSNSNLIQDYSVNETTLEDIFLKFDKQYQRNISEQDTHEQNS